MFIRVKSTPNSPRKSVQICKNVRENGKVRQKVVRHVGIAENEIHLLELKNIAKMIKLQILEDEKGPFLIDKNDFLSSETSNPLVENSQNSEVISLSDDTPPLFVDLHNMREKQRIVEGFHEVFGKLYRELGFHNLLSKKQSEVLENILMARIAAPFSKRRTQGILTTDFGKDVALERIYRMMDALMEYKVAVQKRVFASTERLCFGEATVLLFDVTTLYFESIEVDEVRNFGYSKDQKFHQTQVVLALATTKEGLPIGYHLFPGNTADVSTLLICLEEWKKVLSIGNVIFVGDRAMMSEKNLTALENAGISYVVGAKLKKLSKSIQEKILSGSRQTKDDQEQAVQEFKLANGRRLVVSHSSKRAVKDLTDREKGIKRVHKRIGKGKNLKQLIPNYGYQKFLKTEGEGRLLIDQEKIMQEATWDGFHGLITNNCEFSVKELLAHYSRLWVIEESFRIQKHNLSLRPIYHFKAERIEAHILICYMAFTMIRHFEYRMEKQQRNVTVEDMRQELWRVQASILEDKQTGEWYRMPSGMGQNASKIYQVFGLKRSLKPEKLVKC